MEAASFGRDSIHRRLICRARAWRAQAPSALFFFAALLHHLLTGTACMAQVTGPDFTPKLTQYNHRAWRVQDSALPGTPLSIGQTKDGYLWIGTQSGLVRFDGIRFSAVGPETTPVNALLGSRDGALWVGTSSGLKRLDKTVWKDVVNGHVNSLAQDGTGRIWVARTRTKTPLCEATATESKCFGRADGLTCVSGQFVLAHPDGNIWLSDGAGVCSFGKPGNRIPLPEADKDGASENLGYVMVAGGDGSVTLGMAHARTAALQELQDGAWRAIPVHELGLNEDIEAILRARDGSLWLGTGAHGVYRVQDERADHFGTAEGLSGDSVTDLFQDNEGSIWVVTSGGIDRLSIPKVMTFSTHEGMLADGVRSVAIASRGDLLAGTSNGLVRMHEGNFAAWDALSGLPGTEVTSMKTDSDGNAWLGVDSNVVRFRDNGFQTLKMQDGSSAGRATAVLQDTAGTIWITTASQPFSRLVRLLPDGKLAELQLPGKAQVFGAATNPNGGLWIGTKDDQLLRFDGHSFALASSIPIRSNTNAIEADLDSVLFTTIRGLLRWDGRNWSRMDSANGLPCDYAYQFTISPKGDWWLALRCGDVFIPRSEVERWKRQPTAQLKIEAFGPRDGARPAVTSFSPAITVGRDGRAWFATPTGLQMIDRRSLPRSLPPPAIHLTSVIADHKPVILSPNVWLPALTRNIEIAFDGLSYLSPEEVDFKYRLSGVDTDWQDAGNRHEAFYMNLVPGTYTFQVVARNRDGIWNNVGESLRLTLPPAFYQTAWFKALIVLLGVLMGAMLVRLRVRRALVLLNARYQERLAERDRIARELHDTLLQGFQMLLFRMHTGVQLIPAEEPARPVLEEALDRAERVLVEGRNSVTNLRREPSYDKPLSEELEEVIAEHRTANSPTCKLSTVGILCDLEKEARYEILAIGREALLNALKHAQASNIHLELRYGKRCITLVCTDDGLGMNQTDQKRARASGHFGLVGMRERATKMGARLTLRSTTPGGTTLELRVPAGVAYRRASRLRTLLGRPSIIASREVN